MVADRDDSPEANQEDGSVNRREYVAAVSAAASGFLAGCQSGPTEGTTDTQSPSDGGMDGGDGETSPTQELGERVPQLNFRYWAGMGDSTAISESIAPIIQENARNAIGLRMQIQPTDFLTELNDRYADRRKAHMSIVTGPNDPILSAPLRTASAYHIREAGSSPPSGSHYAACDVTMAIEKVSTAASQDKVHEHMHEFFRQVSEKVWNLTLFDRTDFSAYRNDLVEFPNPGIGALMRTNPEAYLTARATKADSISVNTDRTSVQTHNPHLLINNISKAWWVRYVHSPLVGYDENYELMNVLATNWERENEFKTLRFELRENAVFHDGTPITAEDVKWTFEHINENSGKFPSAQPWPYDSIDVIDDHTVEFNFTENQPAFITEGAPTWGIKHSELWKEAGMEENPTASEIPFPNGEYVGSGPMRLAQFETGQRIRYEPFEGHWRTPESPIVISTFQGQESMRRAFEQGSLNAFSGMIPSIADDFQDTENATVVPTEGWDVFSISPRVHFGPMKFKALRRALSQSVDRKRMADIATFGESSPILYSTPSAPGYPYLPENMEGMTQMADSERPNPDKAKQILRDAGWGWDDQGRLHYPPDADLSPLWEQGESPRDYPERWPCVEELGLTPVDSGSS